MEIYVNNYSVFDCQSTVLNIIQEYLEDNRVFLKTNILNHINSRFSKSSININSNGIQEIITSLLEKKMILEGSKLTKKNVLQNSIRKLIYDFIKENPGVYLYKIFKTLKIGNYLQLWHLDILLKFDYIKKDIINNQTIYFPSNMDLKEVEKIYFFKKKKSKKIIDYLEQNNMGTSKTQLSKKLNMHPYTVIKYLNILEKIKIISKEKMSNKSLYFLND